MLNFLMTILISFSAASDLDSPDAKINCGEFLENVKNVKTCSDLGAASPSCDSARVGDSWMDEMQNELAIGTDTDYPEEVCPMFTQVVTSGALGEVPAANEYCCGG